jgi:hypothetical protein
MRGSLVLACALVFGGASVENAFAYEVVIEQGRIVAPRFWVATATTPALVQASSSSSATSADGALTASSSPTPIPGEVTLAPGGALRVTRTRFGSTAEDVDTRAVVVLLDARGSDPSTTAAESSITVDVYGTRAHPTTAEKVEDSALLTSCLLRFHAKTRSWRVEKKDEVRENELASGPTTTDDAYARTCTASVIVNDSVVNELAPSGSTATTPTTTTRVEMSVDPNRGTARIVAVEFRADPVSASPTTFIAQGIAFASRMDLVELAWSWFARATNCATSLRNDIVSKCSSATAADSSVIENLYAVDVDRLINGCCSAVEAFINSGCFCAFAIVQGSPAFDVNARSSMSRSYDVEAMDDAVESLQTLCFGRPESPPRSTLQDDYEAVKMDLESGGSSDGGSCINTSATLAATRLVVLEDATSGSVPYEQTVVSSSVDAQAEAKKNSDIVSAEEEYDAFLRWLDGSGGGVPGTIASGARDQSLESQLVARNLSADADDAGDRTVDGEKKKNAFGPGRNLDAAIVAVVFIAVLALACFVFVWIRSYKKRDPGESGGVRLLARRRAEEASGAQEE